MDNNEIRTPHPQISEDELYNRLGEIDKSNITTLSTTLKYVLEQMNRTGKIMIIGGVLTKPLPRKDIDAIFVLEPHENDPVLSSFPNEYEWAVEDFKLYCQIAAEIIKRTPDQFAIQEETPPAILEELQNPNILKFNGSIKIKPAKGTVIEIIREPKRIPISQAAALARGPYTILS